LRNNWKREFKIALESDTWGQIEEAKEAYERLGAKIKTTHDENTFRFGVPEKALLLKLATALTLRAREVQDDQDLGIGMAGMEMLKCVLDDVLVQHSPPPKFPFNLPNSAMHALVEATPLDNMTEIEGGSLLPPVALGRVGEEALSIHIEKWGFKDATVFIDPFISISVVDSASQLIESQQDTPPSNRNKPNYVLFGNTVHIQTPTTRMSPGTAIIFEFKHFKPKKKKVSTKAWALMELEEFRNNNQAKLSLEIYKKPTDLKRKNLSLLSVKPLYLHVELTGRVS